MRLPHLKMPWKTKVQDKTPPFTFTQAEVDKFYNKLFIECTTEYGLNESASRRLADQFSSPLRQHLKQ